MAATIAVLGASGFTGGELLRLLVDHPSAEVVAASASRSAGEPIDATAPHLVELLDLEFAPLDAALAAAADIYFSCLPAGALRAEDAFLASGAPVIDLSDDFRADAEWTYGLTEFSRTAVAASTRVANPGCYPTAALLCLVPFARAGLLADDVVVIDALSGVSGAGRRAEDRLLFSGLHGNALAYGTTQHRHIPEIERGLQSYGGRALSVSFTPHLVPMARGLLVTARATLATDLDDGGALDVLRGAYEHERFVHATAEWPQTKAVAGSNHAHVSARVDARNALLVASCAIDNLGKGAAGQAVQNANVLLGLDEATGLQGAGVWP